MKGNEANICFDLLVHRAIDLQMRSLKWDGYTGPCMFVFVSGHVRKLAVELHKSGWSEDSNPSIHVNCYEDASNSFKTMRDALNCIEEELDKWEEEYERRIC